MFNKLLFYFFIIKSILMLVHAQNCIGNNQNDNDETYSSMQSGVRDEFEWRVLKELSKTQQSNVIFSPISLKTVLALVYEGAGGSTKQQLQEVVNFHQNTSYNREVYVNILNSLIHVQQSPNACNPYELKFGSRMYLDSNVKPQQMFETQAMTFYKTMIENVNFTDTIGTSKMINDWVKGLTEGHIKDLVNPDEVENAMMLIANAIYFKGFWSHQFPRNETHTGGFYLSPDSVKPVQYMANKNSYFFLDSKDLDAKILRLPYKGQKFSMILLLPNAKAGLNQLIDRLDVHALQKNLKLMDKVDVEVNLPKFKFDFKSKLTSALKKLGLFSLFENTASLPGIVRGNPLSLQVSDVLQKSGIEVNEEGSVAYASTSVTIVNKFGETENLFNATHPFLFFIEDEQTHTILFIGKVMNPLMVESDVGNRFGDNTPELANDAQGLINKFESQPEPSANPSLNLDAWSSQEAPQSTIAIRHQYFDIDLLNAIAQDDKDNVFISPLSIKAVLAILLEGAKGETATQIRDSLKLSRDEEESREQLKKLIFDLQQQDATSNSILELANALFVSKNAVLNKGYATMVKKYYSAHIASLDFDNANVAAQEINSWVKENTKGLIPEIISPDSLKSNHISTVIANALYFKGMWLESFDMKETKIRTFYNSPTETQKAFMMQKTAFVNYKLISDELEAHVLEMPYNDNKHAMIIILPSTRHAMKTLKKDLQRVQLAQLVKQLEKTEVSYEIPRFDITFETDVSAALKKLEITHLFDEQKANLSGIISKSYNNLFVSNMFHKTKIEVNEVGTIAAASTAAAVIPLMGSSTQRMVADHPFVFFIYRIETKNIIFEGIVNQPTVAPSTLRSRTYKIYSPPQQENVKTMFNRKQ